MAETATAKGFTLDQTARTNPERARKKVQRHSPHRLQRRPIALPGGIVVSGELQKGRIVVRVESREDR